MSYRTKFGLLCGLVSVDEVCLTYLEIYSNPLELRMPVEDRDDYIDVVAQAVIDRLEERDRVSSLVNAVVARVFEIQKQTQEALAAEAAEKEESAKSSPETK
jgi:hypothetical protein